MARTAGLLESVADEAAACIRCPLASTRSLVVFGEGPPDAQMMLVGEAPGRLEDEKGRPFCGRSGALLDQLLGDAGIGRDSVYVTSIVKCRPPGNRDPKRAEIDACSRWLERQLELVSPRIICTLGNFALRRISGRPEGITSVHGTSQMLSGGTELIPLFHPAAALRSTTNRRRLAEDLAFVAERLSLLG